MRRKVILGLAITVLASAGVVGYLLSRDPRQYPLWAGEHAVIATGSGDLMILEDSSTDDDVTMLSTGDRVEIVEDPADQPANRMRRVKILLESGRHKGVTGTVARLYIRPTSLLRGRVDF